MGPRVLFLTPVPVESAYTRYRVHQYLPYLESRGFDCHVAPFISSDLFRHLYRPGLTPGKLLGVLASASNRLRQTVQARRFDVVCVMREAMLFGPPVVEWLLHRAVRRPLVYDFDDAIFVPYVSPTYGALASWVKCPWKTASTIAMSRHVLAGNSYLADFARKHNPSVTVLPTVVDSDRYASGARQRSRQVPVIGWIGSHSTAPYLDILAEPLEKLARRHPFVFRVIGAGRDVSIPGVEVENRPWSMETEISDFQDLDIGVYPIQEDAWSLGKCAFKAIQYMAAGVPSVCSPVGMTAEVVTHGCDGLLAATSDEWLESLSLLIEDRSRRQKMGAHAMETIAERYSLRVHAPRLAGVLEDAGLGRRASSG